VKTEQELFWEGDFGNTYITRNQDITLLSGRINMFSKILTHTENLRTAVEIGPNIGLNLVALKTLISEIKLVGIEINQEAADVLRKNKNIEVHNMSITEYITDERFDLVFTRGVLIHINPEILPNVYDKMYELPNKYILVAEYYNPTPVMIPYRDALDKLYKRDFAGELMDRFKDLKLVHYGFEYRRDNNFPQDDITWFLLKKE